MTEAIEAYRPISDWAASKIGCGYIYGATGWVCTPERRREQAAQYPRYADKILGIGAKWDGVQCFDCAQLTRFAAQAVGASLPSGATSQWSKGDWLHKGTVDGMMDIPGAMLYRQSGSAMQHTGVYAGDGYVIDARGTAEGVVRRPLSSYPWTHWGLLRIEAKKEGPTVEIKYRARVIGDGRLNLRAQADTTSARVTQINPGELVGVLDVYAPDGWAYVRCGDKTGYVMSMYLRDVEDEPDGEMPEGGTVQVALEEVRRMRGLAAEVVQVCDAWLGVRG